MFKPNTVQVPRELILKVAKENGDPTAVYFTALRMMYPRKSAVEIADKFNIEDEVVEFVEDILGSDETEPEAPSRKQQRNRQASRGNYNQNQKKDYPQYEAAPSEFHEWFKGVYGELLPNKKKVHENTINGIYEKFGGDEEYIEAAIMVTADVDENQSEVNSPGGFIMKQADDGKERLMYKADLIENQGTAVKNRESRMNRAKQRSKEYLSKAPPADYSADFLDEEDGDNEQ